MERSGSMSAASISRPGRAARARSANRAMAPKLSSSVREGVSCGPGKLSEGTRQVTSPGTPSPSRLVARIHRSGQQPSSPVASRPDAASTCSQLSSTSSRPCWRSTRITRCARSAPARCSTPTARATAAQTRSGSGTPLRSTRLAPSANRGATAAAPSIASRVLPTPPAPTRVIRRLAARCPVTSETSRSRPTRGVNGSGNPGGHTRPPRTGHRATTVPNPPAPGPGITGLGTRARNGSPSAVKAPSSTGPQAHLNPGPLPMMCSGHKLVNSFMRSSCAAGYAAGSPRRYVCGIRIFPDISFHTRR